MNWKSEFAKAFSDEFQARCQADAHYSMRRFSKDINVSLSWVSECLRGDVEMTPHRASLILSSLNLSDTRKNLILALMDLCPEVAGKGIPEDDFAIITDWIYLAIMASFQLNVKNKDLPAIAERFDLSLEKVNEVVSDLMTKGILRKNESGEIEMTAKKWFAGDGPSSEMIRRHHLENLNSASRALKNVPKESRDFTSSVFAGSLEQLEFLREEIRKLHTKFAAVVQGAPVRDRVLQLTIGLYPLDKEIENRDSFKESLQ